MKKKYPLEQVLTVKKERVDKAQKNVEVKRRALEVEEEKLKKVVAARDEVLRHHNDKLAQLRAVLDAGTTSDEVLQMKTYLKVVKEKLAKEEAKVKEQQGHVRTAQKNLEEARRDLQRKRVEEEKMELHKEHWVKEMKAELAKKETKEHDEIGQILYEPHRRKRGSKESE